MAERRALRPFFLTSQCQRSDPKNQEIVDALHAEWLGKGATILMRPTDLDFGRSFVAADPDGHRLRVYTVVEGVFRAWVACRPPSMCVSGAGPASCRSAMARAAPLQRIALCASSGSGPARMIPFLHEFGLLEADPDLTMRFPERFVLPASTTL